MDLVKDVYGRSDCSLSEAERTLLRQIRVDIPRTHPDICVFSDNRIQALMERSLFIWSIRHPASGYVQGINDLLSPFTLVFLTSQTGCPLDGINLDMVTDTQLQDVEADSYWCLSKMLSHIQDNFTFGQPGIQRLIVRLKDIVRRVDETLFNHLTANGIDFLQFTFRWMNCLLMRELPIRCVIRLWDTYIAEGVESFSTFHVYVCAVFLVFWSKTLLQMDFQQMMLFIQNCPTADWNRQQVETLLAEAYVLKSLFHRAPKHLE